LDGVIDESTVLDAELDPTARTARLRLGVLLHPSGTDAPQPERTLVLRDISRAIVRLRRVRRKPSSGAKEPGPPVLLRDAAGIANWLRRWSGCHLYDQPTEIFDSSTPPTWLSQPSIDLTWPAGAERRHTMDLAFADRRGPGGHTYTLDVRFEFGGLEVLTNEGTPDDAEILADAVAAWWHDMDAGHTNGQYGIYPADHTPALSEGATEPSPGLSVRGLTRQGRGDPDRCHSGARHPAPRRARAARRPCLVGSELARPAAFSRMG
jgi:hypothetical protein